MSIKFRDFVPPQERLGLLGAPALTTLQAAVDAANHWIEAFGIDVFNVETLVLPNLSKDADSVFAELKVEDEGSHWYQLVRVWYREHDLRSDGEIKIFDQD
jgi:hypothetical protein